MRIKLANMKNIDLANERDMNVFTDLIQSITEGYQGWSYAVAENTAVIEAEKFLNTELLQNYGDINILVEE